ncbi:hypothetical protein JB92DRAFT_2781115 [Gautieria morchelliformis]|nr:hypothetical protein JB92DRAFT_2781115 [Gautieria morchelliformis]
MSGLHASPSPAPSPAPGSTNNNTNSSTPTPTSNTTSTKTSTRASMGPQSRASGAGSSPTLALPSPRPGGQSGGGRPTSELLGGGGGAAMFQTPEAEAIDQWFENLQNYEVTLEEMAAASLDVNFKEELSAIEQWFRVLSEAERTAALYSLLQQSTQVQIRFFITVLQQMARSDPMTALLSPAAGGSMQSQMEAKLATLGIKSPALSGSFPSPASPSARNFGRQSLAPDASSNFLSPDTASGAGNDAAATLAQQRAKLQNKANAAHRISAPALGNSSAANVWSAAAAGANQLGQVAEQEQLSSSTLQAPINSGGPRPKSMDLSSLSNLRSPRLASGTAAVPSDGDNNDVAISPAVGGNWASMVNTPAVPMFDQDPARAQNNLDAATMKLYNSSTGATGNSNRFVLDDPKSYRRSSKGAAPGGPTSKGANGDGKNAGVYGDDGNLLQPGQAQPGVQRGNRNIGGGNNQAGGFGWNGVRSPALSSNRFNDNGNVNDAGVNGLGVGGFGLGSPGMMNMNMMGMPGFNMGMLNQMANLNALAAAGLSPDAQAQMFAAQMAAFGGQPGMMGGMAGFAGMGGGGGFRSPGSGRTHTSVRSPSDRRSTRTGGGDKPDEEVDPALLEDVPSWLRSLRLHKYTPNFEGMTWHQMVIMNEQQLEEKGVAALGARRKMLKTFEQVRAKMGLPEPAA